MSINPPIRYNLICSYVDSILNGIVDSKEKRAATIHSFGVAQCCALLAKKRGLNAELASIIGLLHDLYAYKTGHIPLHSINGSEMIRVAFKYSLNGVFTDEEQILIKSAIYHHSDKDLLHDKYDELLKDSDILQHYLFEITSVEYEGARLTNVAKELGISVPTVKAAHALDSQPHLFDRVLLGNIAEFFAKKHIKGERLDADYMNIIRYFPEETAFDELKNAWCAAFVFHCCMKARLLLPIRTPHTAKEVANYRFACVLSWYEWGMSNGFCYFENDCFLPQGGDIVIYKNIIPKEYKPANSAWCDHIGIVLSCDNESLLVAEGNVNNRNRSGIVSRKRDKTIGCYLRIPTDYSYNDRNIDFKTGKTRVVKYE